MINDSWQLKGNMCQMKNKNMNDTMISNNLGWTINNKLV